MRLTCTTWSGSAIGYVEHGYDNDGRVRSQNVNALRADMRGAKLPERADE